MESSVDPVLRILVRARRRLTAAALADALAPPAAGFLLVSAAILAAARWTGREDLPGGLLAAAAILAMLAAAARVARGVPGFTDAAVHLDRVLGAEERFSTVLETAESDPAVAEWAARGALARAGERDLRSALAFRPPAALLPLLLAGTLVAGLGLLPAAPAAAAPVSGLTVAVPSTGSAGGTATTMAVPSFLAPVARTGAGEALRAIEAKARAAGNAAALREIDAARAALARGDEAGAEGAMNRAVSALGVAPSAGAGPVVPGATGSGAAARGGGTPAAADPAFRPLPVPLRAREAVKRYFESGN